MTPSPPDDPTRVQLAVLGMTCAACGARIERVLGRAPGVLEARVNLGTQHVTIDYDPAATGPEALAEAIRGAGYEVPAAPTARARRAAHDPAETLLGLRRQPRRHSPRDGAARTRHGLHALARLRERGDVAVERLGAAQLAAAVGAVTRPVPAVLRVATLRPMDAHVTESLLAARASFLAFLERRLGDRAAAEDILQDAYARTVTHGASLRHDESARAWFYRLLRNAVIDHRRRDASHGRALDALAAELDEPEAPSPAVFAPTRCACVGQLAATMKPEYAAALQQVTVAGQSVKDFATAEGITPNNAAVRVFRAREALRARVQACCGACADDGCADCTCAPAA